MKVMQGTADVHHHSSNPRFHMRIVSLSMRQRLTLLLTCSMRTRRRATFRFPAFCARVSSCPRGFFVGWMRSTPSHVNA